jgi:3-hydroxyacyl-CoA dehydrogenase
VGSGVLVTDLVGVIGCGRLGSTVAQLVLGGGGEVAVLVRRGGGRIERARAAVGRQLARELDAGRLDAHAAADALARLVVTDRPADLAGCTTVFESVPEDLQRKREAVAAVEPWLATDALIASTTSSIPAATIGEGSEHPERVCVAHLVWPAHRTRFAEVAFPDAADEEVPSRLLEVLEHLGVTVLLTRDAPGFLITRVLLGYWAAALELVAAGVSPLDIDGAMQAEGLPMGPIRLLDATGFGTPERTARGLLEVTPEAAPLLDLRALLDAGIEGGDGDGFYRRQSNGREVDPRALDRFRSAASHSLGRAPATSAAHPTALSDVIALGFLRSAARCIRDGVVSGWDDVALAAQRAYGFPSVPGGVVSRWPAFIDLCEGTEPSHEWRVPT